MKPKKTLADYIAIAISPALIMLLVGSLVLFFLEIAYSGSYEGNLRWALLWFVFGSVLISRVAIEQSSEQAAVYALVLGAAVAIVIFRLVDFAIPALGLLGVIWWCTNKLTWDCTLIDEKEDASGEGLLQVAGLEDSVSTGNAESSQAQPQSLAEESQSSGKNSQSAWWQSIFVNRSEKEGRPHSPGLWVVYFSLAALPLFGLGQLMIPVQNEAGRRFSFLLLIVYVASGMALMLTTSFLGLRRYLRQRKLTMPLSLTGGWISTGVILMVAILVLCLFLPRPQANYSIAALIDKLGSAAQRASNFAFLRDNPAEGEGVPANNEDRENQDQDQENQPGDGQNIGNNEQGEDRQNGDENGDRQNGKEKGGGQNLKNGDGDNESKDAQSSEQSEKSRESEPEQTNQQQQDQQGNRREQQDRNQQDDSSENSQQSENNQGNQDNENREGDQERNNDRNDKDDRRGERRGEQNRQQRQQGEAGNRRQRQAENARRRQNRQAGQQNPPPSSSAGQWVKTLVKWIVYLLLALLFLYLVVRHWEQIVHAVLRFLRDLGDFWNRLFGANLKENRADSEDEIEQPVPPPRPFLAYQDPFVSGQHRRWQPRELVIYSFEALEAWAYEQGFPRGLEQTPMEFGSSLEFRFADAHEDVQELTRLYAMVAYAGLQPNREDCQPLRQVWKTMTATSREPADVGVARE